MGEYIVLLSWFLQKHNIPVSAIPCLYYRREKDREAKEKAEKEAAGSNSTSHNGENTSKNKWYAVRLCHLWVMICQYYLLCLAISCY